MSNRGKIRVPGRYERPANLRAELGDVAAEAGIRDGYRAGVAARARVARERRLPACDGPGGPVSAPAVLPPGGVRGGRAEPATVESVATAERGDVELHEAAGSIREAKPGAGGVYVIDVIRSGWNLSGSRYYAAEVLERDVPKVYGAGTQMFVDHPSASEADDRPERSVTTLAAVFLEAPWAVREDDGRVTMRTTARVFSPWQPLIAEAWPHIGVSINGHGRGDFGEAEGRTGLIMEELTYGQSVDFVTRPGAGGRVVGLMESARAAAASPAGRAAITREAGSLGAYVESRIHLGFTTLADELYGDGRVDRPERITLSGAIGDALGAFVGRVQADAPQLYQRGRWDAPEGAQTTEATRTARTREATAEEQRQAIDIALKDAYAGEHRYCWARDYDPDRGLVWFEAGGTDAGGVTHHGTYQQSYRRGPGGAVELLGERMEVRPRVVYDPVRPPAESTATTETPDAGGDAAAAEADRPPTRTTETTAGAPPAGSNPGPAPDITRENDMGEKSPEVVAREAAEARVATLTTERDTAVQERDGALLELARYRAGDAARPVLDRMLAESDLPVPAHAKLRAELLAAAALPLIESTRGLDEGKFRTLAEAAITAERAYLAQFAESAGAGRVTGMGAAPAAGSGLPAAFGASTRTAEAAADTPDQAIVEALVATYERRGLDPKAALAAATGRY
jgi:hypothetical protein